MYHCLCVYICLHNMIALVSPIEQTPKGGQVQTIVIFVGLDLSFCWKIDICIYLLVSVYR